MSSYIRKHYQCCHSYCKYGINEKSVATNKGLVDYDTTTDNCQEQFIQCFIAQKK